MIALKKQLSEILSKAVSASFEGAEITADELCEMLEYPPDSSMGDIAFPCFKLSRTLRCAPPIIAQKLSAAEFDADVVTASAAGPYLNFKISEKYLTESVLGSVLSKVESYGSFDFGEGKTVVLDYSSPNTSKPFHIGHLGTTVIGHCLKLLHEFAGYKCIGINHLGDWGTQNGKQIVAFRKWGNKETVEELGCDGLVELYVKFHEEAEKDPSLNDEARAEFKKLEEHDPDNL